MIKNAYSMNKSPKIAAEEIKAQFADIDTKLVLYFASSNYEPKAIASSMNEAFAQCQTIGCTTAGEIISGKMLNDSIVAMAFDENTVEDFSIEIIENIDKENNIPQAFSNFSNYYEKSMMELEYDKYFGIILIDGLRAAEEDLMEKIGENSLIQFIGASAGDDLKFEKTYVFSNGEALTNAAIIALIKPSCEFEILKTQSFEPMEKRFTITKADEKNREVIEFNHERAAFAYANALEKTIEEVSDSFMSHPVGIMVDGEPYVRSPQMLKNANMKFYCKISEGMEVALLKSRDIVKDTQKDLTERIKKFGNPQGIINFNCILRTLELKQKNKTDEYAKIFDKIPTIGFSTYGEEYIGHINQTATMLLLKKKAA